jgi:hypothetical protein
MEALTRASPGDLPPSASWWLASPSGAPGVGLAREGVAHLRIWTTPTDRPGHVAVVTETGLGASVTVLCTGQASKHLRRTSLDVRADRAVFQVTDER